MSSETRPNPGTCCGCVLVVISWICSKHTESIGARDRDDVPLLFLLRLLVCAVKILRSLPSVASGVRLLVGAVATLLLLLAVLSKLRLLQVRKLRLLPVVDVEILRLLPDAFKGAGGREEGELVEGKLASSAWRLSFVSSCGGRLWLVLLTAVGVNSSLLSEALVTGTFMLVVLFFLLCSLDASRIAWLTLSLCSLASSNTHCQTYPAQKERGNEKKMMLSVCCVREKPPHYGTKPI